MADATIPVDLFNPGQVLACLGFMEAALTLLGEAEAAFDWSDAANTRFALRTPGEENPFAHVLAFLGSAKAVALAPRGSVTMAAWLPGWGPVEELPSRAPYPFAEPGSPATLVGELRSDSSPRTLAFDHWGDSTQRRDAVKFWAGSRGYPGAGLLRDALTLVEGRVTDAVIRDPLALALPQSSSFRLDWRRDYIPIDAGFSLNAHGDKIETVGYPIVEVLGALGLGNARPARVDWRDKLRYRYAVIGRDASSPERPWYPPSFMRAALGSNGIDVFPSRRFHMSLGWPGKEGQARSITTVIEETE